MFLESGISISSNALFMQRFLAALKAMRSSLGILILFFGTNSVVSYVTGAAVCTTRKRRRASPLGIWKQGFLMFLWHAAVNDSLVPDKKTKEVAKRQKARETDRKKDRTGEREPTKRTHAVHT